MPNILYAMITSKSSRQYADIALETFFKNTKFNVSDRFVLIDNDNEGDYTCKVIRNLEPKSFAANCNQLISIAQGRHLIVLSNDVVFTPDWNIPLLQYTNALILPSCNQTHLYSYGDLQLQQSMGISEYVGKENALTEISKHHKLQTRGLFEQLLMAFYAFSLPANVYNKVGFFDESFGIGGGEDVDYRLRALSLDIPVKYISQSYLLHFAGKSTWDGPERQLEIEERNKKYFSKFTEKWGDDLANLCLVGGNPEPVIEKYQLADYINSQEYNKAIKTILNIRNRTT